MLGFVRFNERNENLKLIALRGARRRIHERLQPGKGYVVIALVMNWPNVHYTSSTLIRA
jgi:hypothetical protein